MLQTGDTVDRYTIEALLGEGGMGRVYRAYDPKLHRRVALKVMHLPPVPAAARGENASEGAARMLREARAAAALDHPNAVSIFDVGEVDGAPFIAMELVEGHSLRTYVGAPGIAWDRRLAWLSDVAAALGAAHRRGLVHRDVKPENVMVRNDDVVKVLDFGIARRPDAPVDPMGATQSEALMEITGKNVVVGTLHYMSPEQMRGDALDGRSDQFAWGVLAYELLSGRPPWKRTDDSLANVAQLLTRDPDPLDLEDLPAAVTYAISRALARNREDRFPNMEAVLRVLDPYVAGSSARNLAALAGPDELPPTTRPETTGPPFPPLRTPRPADTSLPAPRTDTNSSRPMPSPSPPLAESKRAARRGLFVAVVAVGALGLAALALRSTATTNPPTTPTSPTSPSASSSSSSKPDTAPLAVTDLPDPPTTNAEALAEYRAAMQAFRDGVGSFDARLKKVVERDPKIAAAWLRIAYFTFQTSPTEARAAYGKAVEHRALLTERDRELLRAFEPWIVWQPPNLDEREKRVADMFRRRPNDAELGFFLAGVSTREWLSEQHLAPLERAVAIDPKFANAWWQLGQQRAYLGDMTKAREALERCLDISGAATACLWNRIVIDEVEGRCEAVEADARRWTTVDANDPLGWFALAAALHARGRPIAAVEETLRKQESLVSAADRPREVEMNAIRIAFAQGDFLSAEKHARALDALVESASGEPEHQPSARAMIEALVESGRVNEAAKYAERYLQRRDAWAPDSFIEDFAIANDVVPRMLVVQRSAGSLDAATFEKKREEWISSWTRRLTGKAQSYALLHGWATVAETKADGTRGAEALAAVDLPAFAPKTMGPSFIGHVYLLAGKNAEALPLLERGAASCQALELPYPHVRTLLWVGQAREANGDTAGACRAYASVVDRWGKAKPKSVTADEARARMTALRCAN